MQVSRTERLILMLPWLIANPNLTLNEIAKRFEISERQLVDDLALLTFIGPGQFGGELVDIQYDADGVNVINHQGLNKPLRFNSTEINLFKSLISGFYSNLSLPLRNAAESILEKLTMVQESLSPVEQIEESNYSAKVDSILLAIRDRRLLIFDYRSEHENRLRKRSIAPMNLLVRNGKDYVNGYCSVDNKLKSFAIAKMIEVEIGSHDQLKRPISSSSDVDEPQIKVIADISNDYLNQFAADQEIRIINTRVQSSTIELNVFNLEYAIRVGLKYFDVLRVIEPIEAAINIDKRAQKYIEKM